MRLPWRFVFTMLPALLTAGCSISAYQYDMVRDVALRVSDRGQAGPFDWRLSFGTLEMTVEAFSAEQGALFGNRDGNLRINFDGWDVVDVRRLPGTIGPINIEKNDAGDIRIHRVPGLESTFKVRCEARRRTEDGWHTACRSEVDGRAYQMDHRLELDSAGRVRRIEAALLPGARPMILERLDAG